jgi:hypothetical protein
VEGERKVERKLGERRRKQVGSCTNHHLDLVEKERFEERHKWDIR